jgi:hypothetical protein
MTKRNVTKTEAYYRIKVVLRRLSDAEKAGHVTESYPHPVPMNGSALILWRFAQNLDRWITVRTKRAALPGHGIVTRRERSLRTEQGYSGRA